MSKPWRDFEGNYALPRFAPCPGYKRACGVSTSRPLCQFCEKTKRLEKEAKT